MNSYLGQFNFIDNVNENEDEKINEDKKGENEGEKEEEKINENNQIEKPKKKLASRPGDWICGYCHNLNFAFRISCNRCRMPKYYWY